VSYPKSLVTRVLDCLDVGRSAREAEACFGVSHENAARWRRQRHGNLRHNGLHPVKYPLETVRMALGLAYDGYGLRLGEGGHDRRVRSYDLQLKEVIHRRRHREDSRDRP
jgi:putative transposase